MTAFDENEEIGLEVEKLQLQEDFDDNTLVPHWKSATASADIQLSLSTKLSAVGSLMYQGQLWQVSREASVQQPGLANDNGAYSQ